MASFRHGGFRPANPVDTTPSAASEQPVCAVIEGLGASADAWHATAPEPTGAGIARAVQMALTNASLTPADVVGSRSNEPLSFVVDGVPIRPFDLDELSALASRRVGKIPDPAIVRGWVAAELELHLSEIRSRSVKPRP